MQMLSDILLASSNKNKYKEAKSILSKFGIRLIFFESRLQEIQAKTLEEVAIYKVLEAFSQCKKSVIVEDDGLFIHSLNGFPGPFSSFVYETIGNKGILKLLSTQRKAQFQSVMAYCDKKQSVELFTGVLDGVISKKIMGKDWGYDPIFIPNEQKKTYAQLRDKNSISHRYLALRKFANWHLHIQEASAR